MININGNLKPLIYYHKGGVITSNFYQDEYKSKLLNVEQVLDLVKDGYQIATSIGAQEPKTVLSQFHKLKGKVKDVSLWLSLSSEPYKFYDDPEIKDTFFIDSWFLSTPIRRGQKSGFVSYVPGHLHNQVLRKLEVIKLNIYMGTCTPMDKHGFVRCPLGLAGEKEFIEAADIVVMEVNPNLPLVHGDTQIPISDIDYFVEVERPVPISPRAVLNEKDITIGKYVSTLVNDGDTIQLGIGKIPDAAAQAFMSKHDLGVHTEMLTSSIADLAKAGVITGKRKTLHKGKIVGAFAFGDKELYDFLDDNPSIALMRATYVNNPFVIAQNDNMVSINTGLEVDLTGQICSESIGPKQWSGIGGQSDFAIGAIHAKNGRSILALYSTAKDDAISTINPTLTPGANISLSRNDLDYVITEYGIAPLKGRSVRERAYNLIAVAHPNFRAKLREEAQKIGFI
jgi:acyl-CoA hydrolase